MLAYRVDFQDSKLISKKYHYHTFHQNIYHPRPDFLLVFNLQLLLYRWGMLSGFMHTVHYMSGCQVLAFLYLNKKKIVYKNIIFPNHFTKSDYVRMAQFFQ